MTTIPNLLKLLFSTFPPPLTDDSEAQIGAYAVALDGHDLRDIEAGVRKLIRGEVEVHQNKAFAPTAAILGEAVRQCQIRRLEHERLVTPPKRLPEPVISDEERARVKAKFDELREGMDDTRKPERVADDRAYWQRANDYFAPDTTTPNVMLRRLRIIPSEPAIDEDGDMGGVAA